MKKKIFSVIMLLILAALPLRAVDYSKPQTILNYADFLADEGDYYRAISEYKRALYYFPNYPKKEWISFQIGRMYYLGTRFEMAKHYLIPLTSVKDKQLKFAAYNILAVSYFENEEYVSSKRIFNELAGENKKKIFYNDYKIFEGLSLAYQNKFAEAKIFFEKDIEKEKLDENYSVFYQNTLNILSDAENLSEKSPVLAGILGIIPGAGHVYLGQWGNALAAITLIGASGYLAYDGYVKQDKIQAGLFLTLSTGFYTGSIFSAYRQAKKINVNLGKDEIKSLKKEFELLNIKIYKNIDL